MAQTVAHPTAPADTGESLAAGYARLAETGLEPRAADGRLRALDLLLGVLALLVLALPMLVIALAVRLSSGSPVLYRGPRVGRAGRVFTMVKFRTLKPDAEARLGPFYGTELDRLTASELTWVGRFLRASHFDEVPQLWNVVRGEMSLVGPRPIRPIFFERLSQEIPQYWQRLVVPPGMTGFAQMRMGRDLSWAEKLAHDLEYIADRSIGLYLKVVAETARLVVTRPVRRLWARLVSAG